MVQIWHPIRLNLAGYAGCINVVAHLTAKELKIDLKDLRISIEGELNTERLFGTSYKNRAGYQQLTVKLETDSLIKDELKYKWLQEIENRCPVNDNLRNVTRVQLSLN